MRKHAVRRWVLFASVCLCSLAPAFAATVHVWTNSPAPAAPYGDWNSAAHSLPDAVAAAQAGDTVLVTDGVYQVTAQINVTNGIAIRSVNGPEVTIVEGGYPATSNRCFYLNAPGAEVSGFTIRNGHVREGGYPAGYGGAVLIMTNGVLSNCVVSSSFTLWRGGGAALYRGGLAVDCLFISNSCNNGGAGLYVESNGVARSCKLVDNLYAGSGNGGGGAWVNNGGTITDCAAYGNRVLSASGGGLWINNDSRGERCTVYSNSAYHGGGVSVDSRSFLYSCLVYGNAASNHGGGIYAHWSRVDGCTAAGNTAAAGGGVYATWSNNTKNTICQGNFAPDGADWLDDGTVTYSHMRTFPALLAPGCTEADPEFRDAAGGDYRLMPGSPMVNAGTNQPWMDAATDLDGRARILNGVVDLGAYELDPEAGPLLCGLAPNPASGPTPLTVELTAHVAGSNRTGLVYGWDFENSGSFDIAGAGRSKVTNTYAALGYHSVRLVVSNSAGETAVCIRSNVVKVGSALIHAAPGGGHAFPFGSWADAATNLADAIGAGADGSLVLVSNGTYLLDAPLLVSHAITLRSVNGRGPVVVDGNFQHRCFELRSSGAQLDGLLVARGAAVYAAGVYSFGATITNCAVYACRASNYAAGVYLHGGLLTDSDVSSNSVHAAEDRDPYGGGVYALNGAVVRRCLIRTNALWGADSWNIYGGGLFLDGAAVEHSEVSGNVGVSGYRGYGGGVYAVNESRVADCRVASNYLAGVDEMFGGGLYAEDSLVTGAVVSANYAEAYEDYAYGGGIAAFRSELRSCSVHSNRLRSIFESVCGGGVYLSGGRIVDSAVSNNYAQATDYDAYGGGLFLENGSLASGCLVAGNAMTAADNDSFGLGIYCADSTVSVCRIVGNEDVSPSGGSQGGGVHAVGLSDVLSCLMAGNFAVDGGGVFLADAGAYAINCTIVSNLAYSGGGVYGDEGLLLNSIVFDNATLDYYPNHYFTGAEAFSCNTTPLLPGDGNDDRRPQFVNAAAGDYALLPGSPGVDDGFNEDWMTNAVDLAGHPRIIGGAVDRGAYELDPTGGPLACNPVANPAEGFYPLQVVFTAAVAGADTTGLYYKWDFDGDGAFEIEGYGLSVVTNLYAGFGSFNVSLTVSNASGSATTLQPGGVRVGPEIAYVATNGAHSFPFTNWVTAATNPHAAYAAAVAGTRIFVGTGTHPLRTELFVDRAVSFEGQGSVADVIVHGGNTSRCFYLCHPGARVSALTIRNGRADYGGGVYFERHGLISNCVVTANRSDNTGGGLFFDDGGEATHCEIWSNSTRTTDNFGGGAYMAGGAIRRCLIHSHTNGGVRINGGGMLDSCIIYSNRAAAGGGLRAYGGIARNCLIIRNQAASQGGGAHLVSGATTVENSTICANSAATSGGGLSHISGSSLVRNCIVRFNSAPTSPDYLAGSYQYTCAAPLPEGAGNTARDPEFADAANDNYRLLPGSPCMNTGTNRAWMTNATDLVGAPRIVNEITDMGAYEYVPGALECNPSADPLIGLEPLWVVFTGYVNGTNTAGLYYQWDFNGDSTWDAQGYGLGVVTQLYPAAGRYSVALAVSNAAGEAGARTRTNLVTVAPRIAYAAPGGAHQYPYTNWAGAATDLVAAVAAAWHGSQVVVSDGVYAIRSPLDLSVAATLRSVNGPGVTIVDGQNMTRCLTLNDAAARAEGLTLTRGRAYQGGGVYFYNGALSNCVVSVCYATNRGGAIYLGQTGLVSRCVLMTSTGNQGGGVFMTGGAVCDTVIRENRATAVGGGVDMNNGLLENCLIVSNYSAQNGGGVYTAGAGDIRNCTIAQNRAGGSFWGGGYYAYTSARIVNTIIYGNTGPATYSNYSGGVWSYSCSAPLPAGAGNIADNPLFVDPGASDFRLLTNSPCVDAGSPTTLPPADILGIPRPLDGDNDGVTRVDMGVYERLHPEADSDGDSLLDTNELAIGTSPVLADTDGDRSNDGEELLAGTDPLDALSVFEVAGFRVRGSGNVVNWSSVNGKIYTVARSTHLPQGVWTPIWTNIAGLAPMNTVTDTTAVGTGPWIYRVETE